MNRGGRERKAHKMRCMNDYDLRPCGVKNVTLVDVGPLSADVDPVTVKLYSVKGAVKRKNNNSKYNSRVHIIM